MKYSIVKFVLLFSFVFYIGCSKKDDNPTSPSNTGQWTQINGLNNFNAIIVNGTNIFAAAGYGIFLSSDNGINWTKKDSGLTYNTPVYALIAHQNITGSTNLFAGTWNGGVFLSTNNGSNWALVNTGLPYQDVACLAMKDSILFAGIGGSGVFRSTNNGSNWTAVNNGLTTIDIYCFATSGTNFFAGTGFGVYRSTNNGNNWALADSGLKYTFNNPTPVGALAVSGTNIYAGVVGGKIFLSKDNGTSWTCIRTGQSNEGQSFPCLAVRDSNIFVGTDAGVFHSTNNGISWIDIDDNLSNTVIVRLFVVNNNIFIKTSDGVVWRRLF
jgi:photosystem II stability/assembly factor-like uncharacterized protein